MSRMQIYFVLLLVVAQFAAIKADWTDHTTGHELFVTLSNERDTVFTILAFKDMDNNPRQIKINDKARAEIEDLIKNDHPGVVYTEIDMSNSNRNAYTYERLATKQLGIKLRELEYGPVAVVIKNGVGQIVVYKGNYDEFIKTADKTIHSVNGSADKEYDIAQALKQAAEETKDKKLDKAADAERLKYFRPNVYDPHDSTYISG